MVSFDSPALVSVDVLASVDSLLALTNLALTDSLSFSAVLLGVGVISDSVAEVSEF